MREIKVAILPPPLDSDDSTHRGRNVVVPQDFGLQRDSFEESGHNSAYGIAHYDAEAKDIVHKKTSRHAILVIQLLNSLVGDSMIMYSPRKRCWVIVGAGLPSEGELTEHLRKDSREG